MSKGRQLPSLWLARTSTNLLPCIANLILVLREYMMQNHPNKLDSLSTTQWLSKQVSHIFISIHESIPPLISRYTSLNKVMRKGILLLLQCRCHCSCVAYDTLVVRKHIRRLINLGTHPHPQLVTQASDILCRATTNPNFCCIYRFSNQP